MLEIKGITKVYKTEGFEQRALDGVSVNFRECEFASILGPSGSGKTTFLNIIGGLDQYTSGDLIINEISTKNFSDRAWDSYRNHRVGFVFQNYNLIHHQSILSNVELALTLSGCSREERRSRALKALKDVGLEKHVNKKPNQLSGGQMQRVAIARALVNDPEIVLADEPTGALDSDTSVQIMQLLKDISKNKLVIMVTHNAELAEEYSSRIINIKDGKIISDSNPYDGKKNTKERQEELNKKGKKTKMSFWTALSLSFNNLMTKKGRTVLVALAGSIGIIGISLILAVSTGFQTYIDSIQEDTLTSYPLTIMQESSDLASLILSMRTGGEDGALDNEVIEQQYITSMLSNISANDLKSFKKYLESNNDKVKDDLMDVKYSYSVEPNIYTIDATEKLAKVNPSNLFSSIMGSSSLMQSYSSFSSIFSEMTNNMDRYMDDYDVLEGRWPESYDEMVIVLSEPNSISDLLIYSLGLRDTDELTMMVTKILNGEAVDINNTPLKLTYTDLLNIDLRLILKVDTYKYNSKYDVYEDMSDDNIYMQNLYDNSVKLKIVGVVSPKSGTTASSLNPGVAYTSSLTDYIISKASESDIVKKQLENSDVDVFSGNRFDSKKNDFAFEFSDLVSIDENKLQSAFNIRLDQATLNNQIQSYMNNISSSITLDTTSSKNAFDGNLNIFISGLFDSIEGEFSLNEVSDIVSNYLSSEDNLRMLTIMESNYVISKDNFKDTYSALLKGLLENYIDNYNSYMASLDASHVVDSDNPRAVLLDDVKNNTIFNYVNSAVVIATSEAMTKSMSEATLKRDVLAQVGMLTTSLSNSIASSFNVDSDKIKDAFSLNFTEDELTRVVSAMMNQTETTQKSNLILLGYQDKDEPTYMSFYFNSFEGKENFLEFIDDYNLSVDDDLKINYSDTTGILMSSVKTIVNAVSYVLIAFVSISLVVSSIMIGVITYISVYERTKEIGILRAIGASKRNISSIFNAETFIIGLLSGMFGIGITYALIPIINKVLHLFIGDIPLSAMLNVNHAVVLVVLAVILTLIGGLIPAKGASKKDPVEALRSE